MQPQRCCHSLPTTIRESSSSAAASPACPLSAAHWQQPLCAQHWPSRPAWWQCWLLRRCVGTVPRRSAPHAGSQATSRRLPSSHAPAHPRPADPLTSTGPRASSHPCRGPRRRSHRRRAVSVSARLGWLVPAEAALLHSCMLTVLVCTSNIVRSKSRKQRPARVRSRQCAPTVPNKHAPPPPSRLPACLPCSVLWPACHSPSHTPRTPPSPAPFPFSLRARHLPRPCTHLLHPPLAPAPPAARSSPWRRSRRTTSLLVTCDCWPDVLNSFMHPPCCPPPGLHHGGG